MRTRMKEVTTWPKRLHLSLILSLITLQPVVNRGSAWGDKGKGSSQAKQLCYVCRKDTEPFLDDAELSRQFPNEELPGCGGREPAAKKVCPPQYSKGCYTETKGGKVVTKMCSGVDISDCQEANDVNYCYCKGQLCNADVGGGRTTSTVGPETDDEDLSGEEGGSGDGGGGKHNHHQHHQTTTTATSLRPIGKEVAGGGHPHAVAASSRQFAALGLPTAVIATALLL